METEWDKIPVREHIHLIKSVPEGIFAVSKMGSGYAE
jgi:hypothetical protein